MRTLTFANWNALYDNHIPGVDYSHVDQRLLLPGARREHVVEAIRKLGAHVVGLQEADQALVDALEATGEWTVHFAKKLDPEQDGCAILVRAGYAADDLIVMHYTDGSGYVAMQITIKGIKVVVTHMKWADPVRQPHVGVMQAAELLMWIGYDKRRPVVLLADCNYRPGEISREMILAAGFTNVHGQTPTALVNGKRDAIDLAAVRNIRRASPRQMLVPQNIPSEVCPSDHVPMVFTIELP